MHQGIAIWAVLMQQGKSISQIICLSNTIHALQCNFISMKVYEMPSYMKIKYICSCVDEAAFSFFPLFTFEQQCHP